MKTFISVKSMRDSGGRWAGPRMTKTGNVKQDTVAPVLLLHGYICVNQVVAERMLGFLSHSTEIKWPT